VDIVNFGVGEPDFDTPANIREAAIRAINEGFTRYTPVGGIPELKEAIARKFEADYGLSYRPGEIVVSCGGKHALYNLFMVLLTRGRSDHPPPTGCPTPMVMRRTPPVLAPPVRKTV
jgi:aspartate aminotransferase